MLRSIHRLLPINSCSYSSHLSNVVSKKSGTTTATLCIRSFTMTRRLQQDLKKENELWTVPNMITISRIVTSPLLGLAIQYDYKLTAMAGCVVAGFSDWLDGFIAKNFNQSTVLGAFLDPVADKVMIGTLTVALTVKDLLPVPLGCLIIFRDVALIALSFVMRHYEKPADAAFFDTNQSATFQISPSELSKINTTVQFLLLTATLTHFSLGSPEDINLIEPLWWITAVTTAGSGLGYLDGTGLKRIGIKGVGRKMK